MELFKKKDQRSNADGWHARLFLALQPGQGQAVSGKTILGKTKRSGPLTVQQPLYPEDGVCHLYLLHPPGGLVGGDCLDLVVEVHTEAHGLMTTPGATKFYRSSGKTAVQKQHFSLGAGAVFEWFPQETILFGGAVAEVTTVIDLAPKACFMGWDIICLGRPASKKRFESGSLISTLTVRQSGVPLLLDRLEINVREDLDACAGLRGFPVSAIFLATGITQTLFDELRSNIEIKQQALAGITLLDQLLVARYLGDNPQEAREFFLDLWKGIRPGLTGQEACLPRIWNT